MTPALRLTIRKQIITVETLTNVSCVPLKNKARCHSQHFWTLKSSLITRHIKHIMKMKLQHIGKKCATSSTKKHKYSLCSKKLYLQAMREANSERLQRLVLICSLFTRWLLLLEQHCDLFTNSEQEHVLWEVCISPTLAMQIVTQWWPCCLSTSGQLWPSDECCLFVGALHMTIHRKCKYSTGGLTE